jgi:hypothetical protein
MQAVQPLKIYGIQLAKRLKFYGLQEDETSNTIRYSRAFGLSPKHSIKFITLRAIVLQLVMMKLLHVF